MARFYYIEYNAEKVILKQGNLGSWSLLWRRNPTEIIPGLPITLPAKHADIWINPKDHPGYNAEHHLVKEVTKVEAFAEIL